MNNLLTVDEIALRYSVTDKTVYNWVSKRFIPFVKFGHLLRFRVDDLQEWEKSLKIDPFSIEYSIRKPLSLGRRLVFET